VQLEEVDALQTEATQAHLDLLAQVGRLPQRRPLVRPLPGEAGLRRDHQVVGVGVQRLAEQVLGDVRAVGVRGVEEGDADLDGTAEHCDGLVVVARRTPDAWSGQLHGAVAEPDDGQVTAERERSGRGCEVLGHGVPLRVGRRALCPGTGQGMRRAVPGPRVPRVAS
jgi:hypothetical protein